MKLRILRIACASACACSAAFASAQTNAFPEPNLDRTFPMAARACKIGDHGLPAERWVETDAGRLAASAGLVIRDAKNYIVVNAHLPKQALAACVLSGDGQSVERIWILSQGEHEKLSKRTTGPAR